MGKLDALLHWVDHRIRESNNNNIVLLRLGLFVIWALEGLVIHGKETFILVDIWKGN